ncbi:hypothetical protein AVEN_5314-1 [Araneus ventricosus]|uniref:Uncharacterized protein n=1 Tax=Araneus ventricosus TaxID=182803 RepID=A0A4Y2TU45_ARAVE|nr:hypothetical protein AVEN_5314-1 [Araneus ventricosus]
MDFSSNGSFSNKASILNHIYYSTEEWLTSNMAAKAEYAPSPGNTEYLELCEHERLVSPAVVPISSKLHRVRTLSYAYQYRYSDLVYDMFYGVCHQWL